MAGSLVVSVVVAGGARAALVSLAVATGTLVTTWVPVTGRTSSLPIAARSLMTTRVVIARTASSLLEVCLGQTVFKTIPGNDYISRHRQSADALEGEQGHGEGVGWANHCGGGVHWSTALERVENAVSVGSVVSVSDE